MPQKRSTQARIVSCIRICGTCAACSTQNVLASIYSGGGPTAGVAATTGLAVPTTSSPRVVITNILNSVLNFVTLFAVAAVVIAGLYLIVGLGSDESREKSKKIIFYTLIGLLVILFSRIIVGLVTVFVAGQV